MYCNSFEGQVLCDSAKASGIAGTSEQVLKTFSLPANSLYKNGQALRIKALFSHAANTNTGTIKLYFGSASVAHATFATSGETGELNMLVVRRDSASQLVWSEISVSTSAVFVGPALTAATEADSAAIVIKATVTGGTSGADLACELLMVEFLQNP